MSSSKLEPDVPVIPHLHDSCQTASVSEHWHGLTIRAELAKSLATALLSNPAIIDNYRYESIVEVISRAVFAADALLETLNKKGES